MKPEDIQARVPPLNESRVHGLTNQDSRLIKTAGEEFVRRVKLIIEKRFPVGQPHERVQALCSISSQIAMEAALRESIRYIGANPDTPGEDLPDEIVDFYHWTTTAVGTAAGMALDPRALGPFAGYARELFVQAFDRGAELTEIRREAEDGATQ